MDRDLTCKRIFVTRPRPYLYMVGGKGQDVALKGLAKLVTAFCYVELERPNLTVNVVNAQLFGQ